MNNLENHIQASTNFISHEMQELLERTLFLIPNWKWLTLAVGLFILYFLRHLILNLLKKLKAVQPYFRRERSFMQFFFKLNIEKGLSWSIVAIIGINFVTALELIPSLERFFNVIFKLILAGNIIRVAYLAADALGSKIQDLAKATNSAIHNQLAPLATKSLKTLVIIIGTLVALQNLGVNVTALLAGLGLGGIALAFAAQDTVANVFGTVTILLDAPFRLGDRVKIGDIDGVIEEVGFRSTRIRTLYNSVVVLPNSVVAKEKIDNLTDRNNWIRFRNVVGVTYNASPMQITKFCTDMMESLSKDPAVNLARTSVNLDSYADSSINISVVLHYKIDFGQNEATRNQMFLEMIRTHVLNNGMDFAFPTLTLIQADKPPQLEH